MKLISAFVIKRQLKEFVYIPTEMESDFKLLLISPEQNLKDEIEIVCELFSLGLETYHLRKPDWGVEELQEYLEALPKRFHSRIVLHSHFGLEKVFGVKGIHLNENNKKLIQEYRVHKIISASFHSLEDISGNRFPYEYVFLSPVFDSISKAEHRAKSDLKFLAENLAVIRQQNRALPKVIALGGINAQNITSVKQAGFSGAAVLGAVWQSENPVEAFLEIQTIATR